MEHHLTFLRSRFVIGPLTALLVVVSGAPIAAQNGATPANEPGYRLFLADGSAIATVGEFARVGDRVVFSIAPGNDQGRLEVVSLPASTVDWTRTDQYTLGVRASRYAASRGEADYAALASVVARALTKASQTTDVFERLQAIEEARGIVVTWGRDHFAYRATDVRRIEVMLDDMVAEMRAQAGIKELNLELVANVDPPPPIPETPPLTLKESIEQVLRVANASDVPAERVALQRAALRIIDRAPRGALPSDWAKSTRNAAAGAMLEELRIDRAYRELASTTLARSRAAAARADSTAVEEALADAQRRNEQLGQKRPNEMSGLVAALEHELDAARRLRLARDKWRLAFPLLRDYNRLVKAPVRQLSGATSALEAIRRVAGPDVDALLATSTRLQQVSRTLQLITPPADISSVHKTLTSACQMALRATELREKAIETGNLQYAWDASSAASGALMLLAQAREQLQASLRPPQLPAPQGASK